MSKTKELNLLADAISDAFEEDMDGGYPSIVSVVGDRIVQACTEDGTNKPTLNIYTKRQAAKYLKERAAWKKEMEL